MAELGAETHRVDATELLAQLVHPQTAHQDNHLQAAEPSPIATSSLTAPGITFIGIQTSSGSAPHIKVKMTGDQLLCLAHAELSL